jgi:exopolyphosphatase / guanosine-5'-triphosphate,3'-diphosphate pyrophosphatase
MRRMAVIDVGSNTAKLVDYAYEPGVAFRRVDELRANVRLAEGMGPDGVLRAEPFERGVAALRTFASYCRAVEVDDVVATATSAVRGASNGGAFVAAVRERAGIELRVLEGTSEARVAALAVANATTVADATVVDLGGGSMQLSALRSRRFVAGASWPLGAVRTTETFLRGDPPKAKGVRALARATRAAVASWFERATDEAGGELVGLGGTLRNLADVDQQRRGYPLDLLHGYRLSAGALHALADDLVRMKAAQRSELPGLNRDRADIIAAGAVVWSEVVRSSRVDEVLVSGQGLRDGLFYPRLVPDGEHLLSDVRAFSVRNLMRQHLVEGPHDEHVQALAWQLFDQTAPLHGFGAWERDLLGAAALLHDVGMAVDAYRHDHHGKTLVLGRALPGFEHREQALIALLVRFHRKGQVGDEGLGSVLASDDLTRVRVLAGILRVAEHLDRGKAQRVRGVEVHLGADLVQIVALGGGDARLEIEMARERSDLLANALGAAVEVLAGVAPEVER